MKNRLGKWFYSLFYNISNALKNTEEEVLTSQDLSIGSNIGIHKEVNDKRLAKHLIKGEITQEVVEMRYRDYKVSREAAKYKYNGDGTASKVKDIVEDISKKEFVQDNALVIKGILDTLQQNAIDGVNNFNLTVQYQDIPRFKLEAFCKRFDLSLKKSTIKLHFERMVDDGDKKCQMFYNEAMKMVNSNGNRHEFASNVVAFSFVTYKAVGEDDLINYTLTNIAFDSIEVTEKEFVFTYKFGNYVRNDLTSKFYCEDLEKKYKNKTPKRIEGMPISYEEVNKKFHCDVCGKEVHPIDAKLTKHSTGQVLCQECLTELDKIELNN